MTRIVSDLLAGAPVHCVYVLRDEAGAVLYVGSTASMHLRLSQHMHKPYGPAIAAVEVTGGLTKPEARRQERLAIETLHPIHNKQRVIAY